MNECLQNLRQWPENFMSDAQTQFISPAEHNKCYLEVSPSHAPLRKKDGPTSRTPNKYLYYFRQSLHPVAHVCCRPQNRSAHHDHYPSPASERESRNTMQYRDASSELLITRSSLSQSRRQVANRRSSSSQETPNHLIFDNLKSLNEHEPQNHRTAHQSHS